MILLYFFFLVLLVYIIIGAAFVITDHEFLTVRGSSKIRALWFLLLIAPGCAIFFTIRDWLQKINFFRL